MIGMSLYFASSFKSVAQSSPGILGSYQCYLFGYWRHLFNSSKLFFRDFGYADITKLSTKILFYVEYILTYIGLLLDAKKRVR